MLSNSLDDLKRKISKSSLFPSANPSLAIKVRKKIFHEIYTDFLCISQNACIIFYEFVLNMYGKEQSFFWKNIFIERYNFFYPVDHCAKKMYRVVPIQNCNTYFEPNSCTTFLIIFLSFKIIHFQKRITYLSKNVVLFSTFLHIYAQNSLICTVSLSKKEDYSCKWYELFEINLLTHISCIAHHCKFINCFYISAFICVVPIVNYIFFFIFESFG